MVFGFEMKEKETSPVPAIRVLICDDDPRIRKALKDLLLTRQITQENDLSPVVQVIGEACHGSQVIQMVEHLQPEVILMDVRMPGMDGVEATRFIKQKWPSVRIVMLTMDPEARSVALDAGVDTFLLKGCPLDALFDAILD